MNHSSTRGAKTFGFRNQPQEGFLPSIFSQPQPMMVRHSVKLTSFEKNNASVEQESVNNNRSTLPGFNSKIRGFQEMANAFDEIIIESADKQNGFVEGEIDRRSDEEDQLPKPQV